MSDLILHSYDASPFTQRALRLLGIKNLAWRWVETPMMPPKDDLVELTGGYRGTPVLQIGSDVYIDSARIALELDRRYPEPPLLQAGGGLELALITWSDAFFRSALKIIIATSADTWPEPFRKDREQLFPDIDFGTVGGELEHARTQYRASAFLLERQLADGRDYLGGSRVGLMDAFVHPFVWVMRGALPGVAAELLDGFRRLADWEQRVAALGEGQRTRIEPHAALEAARSSAPAGAPAFDPRHAGPLRAGMRVAVAPQDSERGTVLGEIVGLSDEEIAVRRGSVRAGTVIIHFPRLGYRVTRLDS